MSDADKIFFALSDPTRREVLRQISTGGEVTPTDVAAKLPVSRQAVSKHLEVLLNAGLVAQSKRGRETIYSPTPGSMDQAIEWMADVGGAWDERFKRLRKMFDPHASDPH